MTIATIFAISLTVLVVGIICAAINFAVWARRGFVSMSNGDFGNVGKGMGKALVLHIICGVIYVLGGIATITSGIIWIARS